VRNALIIIVLIFLAMQVIQVEHTNPVTSQDKQIQAPPQIMAILKKSCYDCHSNEVAYPWYSNVAPFSWMIAKHVKNARASVNFSAWQEYSKQEQEEKLRKMFRAIYAAMPLGSYLSMHEEAQLSKEERTLVRDWIGYNR
jgi:uncharacterized membrane protein